MCLLQVGLQCQVLAAEGGDESSHAAAGPRTNSSHPDDAQVVDMEEAFDAIKHQNWTHIATQLRNPANRGYAMVLLMIGSLWLSLFGKTHIKTWLFLGGFASVAISFYLSSPQFLDFDFCCVDDDTQETRVILSVVFGLITGGLAILTLKVGVFLTGTCLGLGFSLAIRTTLAHMHVFQSELSFAMFYAGCAVLGGIVALYKDQPVIALATSLGGSLGVFIGVGHFAECPFLSVITHVEKEVEHHATKTPESLPQCAIIQGACFLILFIATSLFQLEYLKCGKATEDSKGNSADSKATRHRWVRTKVSDQVGKE